MTWTIKMKFFCYFMLFIIAFLFQQILTWSKSWWWIGANLTLLSLNSIDLENCVFSNSFLQSIKVEFERNMIYFDIENTICSNNGLVQFVHWWSKSINHFLKRRFCETSNSTSKLISIKKLLLSNFQSWYPMVQRSHRIKSSHNNFLLIFS